MMFIELNFENFLHFAPNPIRINSIFIFFAPNPPFWHPPLPFPAGEGGGWPGEGPAPDRARGAGKSVPGAPTAWQPPAPSARLLRRGGPSREGRMRQRKTRPSKSAPFAPLRSLGLRPRSAVLRSLRTLVE